MKLFLDTNIVLDLLQYREPWVHDTLVLFQLAKEKRVELIVSDLTFVNVVYIAGKNVDKKKLNETLVGLKKFLTIVPIGDACIEQALSGDYADFEDAVQCFAAKREKVDYILSRDEKGFYMSEIPVMNVTEFLNSYFL
jgi:predicted nucleic acid-binding protein